MLLKGKLFLALGKDRERRHFEDVALSSRASLADVADGPRRQLETRNQSVMNLPTCIAPRWTCYRVGEVGLLTVRVLMEVGCLPHQM